MAGFCGPGSLTLLGFLALIAPCGGSFGLPKEISLFTGVAGSGGGQSGAGTPPPAALAANTSRRENIVFRSLCANDKYLRRKGGAFWSLLNWGSERSTDPR